MPDGWDKSFAEDERAPFLASLAIPAHTRIVGRRAGWT